MLSPPIPKLAEDALDLLYCLLHQPHEPCKLNPEPALLNKIVWEAVRADTNAVVGILRFMARYGSLDPMTDLEWVAVRGSVILQILSRTIKDNIVDEFWSTHSTLIM